VHLKNLRREFWVDWQSTLVIDEKMLIVFVATLALGLRPRQRGCKSAGQEEARESHHVLLGV